MSLRIGEEIQPNFYQSNIHWYQNGSRLIYYILYLILLTIIRASFFFVLIHSVYSLIFVQDAVDLLKTLFYSHRIKLVKFNDSMKYTGFPTNNLPSIVVILRIQILWLRTKKKTFMLSTYNEKKNGTYVHFKLMMLIICLGATLQGAGYIFLTWKMWQTNLHHHSLFVIGM